MSRLYTRWFLGIRLYRIHAFDQLQMIKSPHLGHVAIKSVGRKVLPSNVLNISLEMDRVVRLIGNPSSLQRGTVSGTVCLHSILVVLFKFFSVIRVN